MTDIAKLALAAAQAEEQAQALEQQAQATRERADAQREIALKGQRFSIEVDIDAIAGPSSSITRSYTYTVQVDDDATLVIEHKGNQFGVEKNEPQTKAKVRPSEQLYWDLPPGVTEKGRGGGIYGNYGLSTIPPIDTLADLGRVIALIRSAREQWRAKHEGTDA